MQMCHRLYLGEYACPGFQRVAPCPCTAPRLTSFQSCSPYNGGFTGTAGVAVLRMAAMDEVSTTRFTLAFDLMTDPITFSVP